MSTNDPRGGSGLYLPAGDGWSRRRFLATVGIGAGALSVGGLLSSCQADTKQQQSAGKPKRGGTLHFGCSGGTQSDTLDGAAALQPTDWVRSFMLYDGLARFNNQGKIELRLAESIEPNNDGTEWTVKVRPGITTHQGKDFGAKDILWGLRRMVDNALFPSYGFGPIDLKNSKVVDATTLVVKYSSPYAVFLEAMTNQWMVFQPEGWTPKNPDGTGPFVYESFTPGVQSTFTRNGSYWNGEVYLDSIVTTNIADETGQVNALKSGEIELANQLSASSMSVLKGGGFNVTSSKTGTFAIFTMRSDIAPFNDPKLRQAMRLLVDRQQMLDQVFGGIGAVGNDVMGLLDPLYDSTIPQRERDIDQAKSLLASAGASDFKIDLYTGPNFPGEELAAQVFATQAKDAGVTVNVVTQNSTDYFAKSYAKVPLSQDFWPTMPYLINAGMSIASGKDGPFNASHFDDHEYNDLFAQATGSLDEAKRTEYAHAMQQIEYDRGSLVLPFYMPQIDASAPSLQGLEPSVTGYSPGGFYFDKLWFDK